MPEPYELIIMVLATWRLSHMLTKENGPFGAFLIARNRLGGALECIYCLSVWIACGCLFLWHIDAMLVLLPFAVSGAAMILRSYTGAGIHV